MKPKSLSTAFWLNNQQNWDELSFEEEEYLRYLSFEKEKDVSRLAVYLATYNDSKKIKNSMTEHGIYEFGRRLANLMNIDFR